MSEFTHAMSESGTMTNVAGVQNQRITRRARTLAIFVKISKPEYENSNCHM